MNLTLITQSDVILGSKVQWNVIAQNRPFFRWEWLAGWLAHQVDSVTPALLVGSDDQGRWIGIAPFCVECKSLSRKLRFLGSGTVCSDYLGLITHPDHETVFAEAIADWLTHNIRPGGPLGTIDAIELEGVSRSDQSSQYFQELLIASGFESHKVELEGCWATDLPSTWEEMDRRLSKSLRRKTKKASHRLADPTTQVLSSDDDDVAELWNSFVELHQKRRNTLGQSGCFARPNFAAFLQEATTKLISAERAELLIIRTDGKPLAGCLLLNDGTTNFMYQSGFDPDNAALEPGYQIVIAALRTSIRKGLTRFDFLRGDEPYKSRWLTERIPLVRIRLIPRNFTSQLKHEIWKTAYSFRQWCKPTAVPIMDGD